MKVNQYLIRVQASKVPITQELQIGDSVSSVIMGDIVKVEDEDNQNGTIDRCYVIKGRFAECITRDKESIVKDGKTDKINGRSKTKGKGLSI